MNSYFETKIPFAYNYFSNLLNLIKQNKRTFPQALIFEGNDVITQYLFTLELARILNCQNNGENNCNCYNCKWIKSHTHPCINNVSQIHFKGEDDKTKTVISVKQAFEIEKAVSLSTDFHRFFIFFSSKEGLLSDKELKTFEMLGYDSNIDYLIEPLNYSTFHPTTLNSMLKIIEEPGANTTFVFLTKSKEDILPTIVSRCLTFKLSGKAVKIDYSGIIDLMNDYPNIDFIKALSISEKFTNFIKDNSIESTIVLNMISEYLKDILKNNIQNDSLYLKIKKDIVFVNVAIKQIKSNVSYKNVFENLFLKIARGF